MLTKKTTILFPKKLHDRLKREARRRKTSMGKLVREACETQFGGPSIEEGLALLKKALTLNAPVGSPAEMKAEYLATKYKELPGWRP